MKVEQAFPREVADAGRAFLWRETGCDPDDPTTWTQPVIRLVGYGDEPFRQAATAPALQEACDQLVGKGAWVPRKGLGGFPIRFPSAESPGDDGWHIDASFPGEDPADYAKWRINLYSKGRALLMLFLFSDVTAEDAPTRIRVGSHLRLPKVLAPYGEPGAAMFDLLDTYAAASGLPQALATGGAGDVYLCHPFLVHAAQPHHGRTPRFMAQPPLELREPCVLDRPDGAYSPVEQAIRLGLA
ncbi:phytanoyl-CoA dioxygenase family protein [Nocardia sp. NBC_01503]|uniref:phytanoyl-CoA dioxygenase family protein n=1 Tax=Nocardia sp. NBC_01503 TaxID=2975997 RepID=UPI002E7AD354|nr:phytanoyl-CoA dioxygenase family protein [Nocardia sp. NBC_01503]